MAPDETGQSFRISPRLILGLGLMAGGLVLMLDSLGLLDADDYTRFWPLLVIGVGIAKLFQPCGSRAGAAFWVVVGAALLSATTGLFSFGQIWPLILFILGAHIAWRSLAPRTLAPSADPTARLDMFAFMGGSRRSVASDDFKGGSATAVMGGCEIDLRSASIAPGEAAILDCFAMWGGVDIRVPPDWVVANEATVFLGGVEDKSHPEPGSTKRLVLTGIAVMGGIEVKN